MMNPQALGPFAVGNKVRCIRDRPWEYIDIDGEAPGPKLDEICTILGITTRTTANPFVDLIGLWLKGHPAGWYSAGNFVPVEEQTE